MNSSTITKIIDYRFRVIFTPPPPKTVTPNLEEPLPMIPWLLKVSMLTPLFPFAAPSWTLAVLFPPIRVPLFKKVEVEEFGWKFTACCPSLEIVIVPLLSITRVLPVSLIVLVKVCKLFIVSLFEFLDWRPDLALACLFVSS